MLVVISNPEPIDGESDLINDLFQEGMETFHLRKPKCSYQEVKALLEEVKAEYHHRISLHQHHLLRNEFNIKRLHYTVAERIKIEEKELYELKKQNLILSTSIHHDHEMQEIGEIYNYVFFGPVFNSISKKGYTSSITNGFVCPVKGTHTKVIAIGGIDETNIRQAVAMQFDGVAVLGSLWQKPEKSIRQYKALQNAWKQTDLLC